MKIPEGYEDPDSGQWVSSEPEKKDPTMNNSGDYRPWFDPFDPVTTNIAAAPTPPAPEKVELPKLVVYESTSIPKDEWRNMPIDYWLRQMLENCDYHDGLVIQATLTFLEGLSPEQEDEPVGYRYRWRADPEDTWSDWNNIDRKSSERPNWIYPSHEVEIEALYNRPQSDDLRKAAKDLVDYYTRSRLPETADAFVKVQNLRAALEKKS